MSETAAEKPAFREALGRLTLSNPGRRFLELSRIARKQPQRQHFRIKPALTEVDKRAHRMKLRNSFSDS